MSDTPFPYLPVLLNALARDAYRQRRHFDQLVTKRAARSALQKRKTITPIARRMLNDVAEGKMNGDVLQETSADAWFLVKTFLPAARVQVRERHHGLSHRDHDPGAAWNYAVRGIVLASGHHIDESELDRCFGKPEQTPRTPKRLRARLAELDANGFTNRLLADLWRKWPERCKRMDLPAPTSPATTENARQPMPVVAATADEAVEILRDEWATYAQLAAVTGLTKSSIRSAFHRANDREAFTAEDKQDIPEARPGMPRQRFRIRGVWQHLPLKTERSHPSDES